MTGMEHAIEQVANALHGDQCAEDPDPGERCNCGADDFYRQAEIVLDTLREAGLLAPAPLTEEWAIRHPHLGLIDKRRDQAHAERGRGNGWDPVYRHSTGWLPVDRAE